VDWRAARRGTLLMPSGPTHDSERKHLFIICAVNVECAFLASISKWSNELCDDTCILDKGEHPFITAKSYVLYRKCRIELCETLKDGVESGRLISRDPLDDQPFARVCGGILTSKQTPWKLKQAFKNWV
jgi:hypothetical protein